MRGWAWGIVVVGALLAIIGLVLAVVALDQAGSMNQYQRHLDPELYDDYMTNAQLGFGIMVLGVIVAVVGVIAGAVAGPHRPVQPMSYLIPSDRMVFCPYCGSPLQGAITCRSCGRRIPDH
jgi:hypothetical protein